MNSIQKAYSYIDSAYPEMIYTLQKWVSVPSLKADPAPDAPLCHGPLKRCAERKGHQYHDFGI